MTDMTDRITVTKETKVRDHEQTPVGSVGPAYDWEASDGRKFWASEAFVMFTGQEILVFEYNKDGSIDFLEVAGGRGISFGDAKSDLERYLNE